MSLTKADVNDIFEFLVSIRGKWFMLGTSLRLNTGKLEDIQRTCGNTKTGLLEMVKLWLKSERSWAELAKALDSGFVEEEELAEEGNCMHYSVSEAYY
jgi:hypothetical protein